MKKLHKMQESSLKKCKSVCVCISVCKKKTSCDFPSRTFHLVSGLNLFQKPPSFKSENCFKLFLYFSWHKISGATFLWCRS